MNIEDIKVGETYNVPFTVRSINGKYITATTDGTIAAVFIARQLHPIPKHDPCRLFKSGDIVEMDTHGRDIAASMKKSGVELGKRYTVTEDENNTGYVSFIGDDGIEHHSLFFWLKLVTPVEEIEPYSVVDAHTHWDVADNEMRPIVTYSKARHPHAKAAAEAERDRLNVEWRKEHAND